MGRKMGPGLLALTTALVAMGAASMALYVPSLPAIQADFDVGSDETQRTLSYFFIGFASGQLVFGPLSDRFGRRPVLLTGLILYALVSLALAFAWDIGALQTGRFLQGLVACVGPVVGRALVRDLTGGGADAAAAYAVIGTALAVVPAMAPMLGGLTQVHFGWRANFLILCGGGLLLWCLCLFVLRETLAERNPDATDPRRLMRIYGGLITNGYFMGQVLVCSLALGGFFAYFTLAPFLFIGGLGVDADTFGYLMVFTVIGFAAGSFAAGKLIGRWSARRVILIGCGFLLTGSCLLLAVSDVLSLVRVIGPMCVYTIGFGMVIPGSMAEALRPFPRVAGSASAVMGFVQFLAAAAASLIVQPLYDGAARTMAFVVLGFAVTTLVQFLILTRKGPSV